MSSACVCHTDEWCFYCEMYVPLEKERDELLRSKELADKAVLSAFGLIRDLENELIGIKNVAVKAIEHGNESIMKTALTSIKWAVESVIYEKEPENEQNQRIR